jgi:hypothetical protein
VDHYTFRRVSFYDREALLNLPTEYLLLSTRALIGECDQAFLKLWSEIEGSAFDADGFEDILLAESFINWGTPKRIIDLQELFETFPFNFLHDKAQDIG